MVLDRYRDEAGRAFTPFALALGRLGFTPNTISVSSLAFALGGGAAFYAASPAAPLYLIVAAALVALNGFFDAFDGLLARAQKTASRRGDYLDHVIDRYADVAMLVGVALCPLADVRLGLLAIVGTSLTSYMGTQAQALGLGRNYAGFLGRADRLVIILAVPALVYLSSLAGLAWPWSPGPIVWMLVYLAVVGNLTAAQRFWSGWRALR